MKFVHSTRGTLAAKAPFDFTKSLGFVAGFPMTGAEQTTFGGVLRKGAFAAGIPVLCEVRDVGNATLAYAFHSVAELDAARVAHLETQFRRYLSLDDDLAAFYTIARTDAAFAPVLEAGYGFHHVRFFTPIEIAIWSILAQRSPRPIALAIKAKFVERHGATLWNEGIGYPIFPELATLARLDAADIMALVRNERKARYIYGAIRAFASVDDTFLHEAPLGAVRGFLRSIPGIGPWSENFIALRGLGRMDYCDPSDALFEAAREVYREHVDAAWMQEKAALYGAAVGHWAFYLRAVGVAVREATRPSSLCS